MNNYNTINKIIQSSFPIENNNIQIKYNFEGFSFTSCIEFDHHFTLNYSTCSNQNKCKKCNSTITRNKGYRTVSIRFGSIDNKAIYVVFKKKIFMCNDCNCCTIQATPNTSENCQHSDSFKKSIINELSSNVSTYTSVVKGCNTSISTVIRTFDNYAQEPVIDTMEITALNVDETKFIPNLGSYQFVVIDSNTNDVVTMTADRLKTTVVSLYEEFFPNVKVINQDLWETYRRAAYEAISEDVCIIADPFHVVRQGTWAFNRERRGYMKSKETKLKVNVT